ncbi:MAG: hypothetical protein LBB41_07755 [Prevotellaceae bacterium]|jgi:hypothetical protein|nr:hypothetical protein [Prevotellaceae bacterium]
MSVLIQILKNFLLKVKAFLLSKNALTFLVFLLISGTTWFLNALDKEQNAVFRLPVRYVGIPQNIIVTDSLPTVLTLYIRDNGRQIFSYSRRNRQPMTIDLTRTFYEKGEIIITADQLRGQIMRYMLPTTTVENIKPDTIAVDYEKLSTGKVTVLPQLNIELAPQYMLCNEPQVEPNVITVFASQSVLDTLQFVYTQPVIQKKLSDSAQILAELQALPNVRFSTNKVNITLNVEMFTEKTLQIPVTIVNSPANVMVKTFPGIVDVTFNVGVSYFNKVNANDIQVAFDFRDIHPSDNGKIALRTKALARHISNIQLNPSGVEFVIENR